MACKIVEVDFSSTLTDFEVLSLEDSWLRQTKILWATEGKLCAAMLMRKFQVTYDKAIQIMKQIGYIKLVPNILTKPVFKKKRVRKRKK